MASPAQIGRVLFSTIEHCSSAMGFCQKKGQGNDFLISLMEFEKMYVIQ